MAKRKSRKNTEIEKRAKSLAWRFGMMGVALGLNFLTENIGMAGLGAETTVIVGLMLGELTKYLNNRYDLEQYFKFPAQS